MRIKIKKIYSPKKMSNIMIVEDNDTDNKLLGERKEKANQLYNKLNEKDRLNGLKDILNLLETDEKYNYELLKEIKTDQKEFETYYNKLRYTISNTHLKDLNISPIPDLKKIFLTCIKEIMSDNKDSEVLKQYNELFKKKVELNYPLIDCIEKARLALYIYYIIKGKNRTALSSLKDYISVIEEDLDKIDLDSKEFNIKLYLFILHSTYIKGKRKKRLITNSFLKGTKKEAEIKYLDSLKEELDSDSSIKKIDENTYIISDGKNTKKIEKKYYNIDGIKQDLYLENFYPLEFILIRNESIVKYLETKQCFLERYELYDEFIKYIKVFIKSRCVEEALNTDKRYEELNKLIKNDKYLDEILSKKHLKFLPLYYSEDFCGITNKELEISIINAIPRFCNINKGLSEYRDLFNLLLLFSIGLMFITCLHEILIHLSFGYLLFYSNKKLGSDSPKTKTLNDGGYFFEDILGGTGTFRFMNLQKIIILLDGESCHKSLVDFKKALNSQLDLTIFSKKQYKGFLGHYLKTMKINFEEIDKNICNNLNISGRNDQLNLNSLFISNPINLPESPFGGSN